MTAKICSRCGKPIRFWQIRGYDDRLHDACEEELLKHNVVESELKDGVKPSITGDETPVFIEEDKS